MSKEVRPHRGDPSASPSAAWPAEPSALSEGSSSVSDGHAFCPSGLASAAHASGLSSGNEKTLQDSYS